MSRRPGVVFRTHIFKIYTKNSILGDQKLDSKQNFMIFLIDSAKIQFEGFRASGNVVSEVRVTVFSHKNRYFTFSRARLFVPYLA